MKMVMAVVQRDEVECVLQGLIDADHTATFTESRGGMLRQARYSLFIAVEEKDLDEVLGIIRGSCYSQVALETSEPEKPSPLGPAPATARVGGAVVFVWDLDHFEIY